MTEDVKSETASARFFAEVVLHSGKHAVLTREPMGHDMERAVEAAPNAGNMIGLSMALFAVAGGKIDGRRVSYEELRHELSALDAYRLTNWVNAGFELMPTGTGEEPPASPL